jgi:glycosyltransferase involved in cell wall biosynthesis
MRGARAFVFAAEEDFGILPVEAQACGTPVIAYGRGGAREAVRVAERGTPTGIFFDTQSAAAIAAAVRGFEALAEPIDPGACRANALAFSTPRFVAELTAFVERARGEFVAREG